MKKILFLITLASTQAFALSTSVLCTEGKSAPNQISFTNPALQARATGEIALVTWNAHKLADSQYFYDFKRLSTDADIMMMQEAMHSSGWQAAFASHMPMSYTFFKSFCDFDDQANGVMTASRYALENTLTLTSEGTEPVSFTPKVSGYSTVNINGQIVHLINTHALNFNTGSDFEKQIDQLVMFISGLSGPVIWAGDFNTWNPLRKTYLDIQAQAIGLDHVIPENDPRNLILDHIYTRGFSASKTEVLLEKTSDHYPIRTILKFK